MLESYLLPHRVIFMPQSLHQVYGHLVFSTKNRAPKIHAAIEKKLYAYICGILQNLDGSVIAINGMSDHIHILFRAAKNHTDIEVVQKIKGSSSKWVQEQGENNFQWQKGYAWFSVSAKNLDAAKQYVDSQKEHHAKVSFKDELLKILRASGVAFDEQYLWD